MRWAGTTVCLLFFGLVLLDGLLNGPWPRATFWVAIAAIYVLMDRWGHRKGPTLR